MAFKWFEVDFNSLKNEPTARFDFAFINFFNKSLKSDFYSFKDLFEVINFEKNQRTGLLDEIDEDFNYCEIGNATKQGDLEPQSLNFNNRTEDLEPYFTKIEKGDIQKAEEGNILVAKVRPNLKKYLYIDEEKSDYYYTTAFINLKPKKLGKILYYSLRTIFFENLMAISRQGKGYPTMNSEDLNCLKFDKNIIDILEEKQTQIIVQITPIEQEIKSLKSQIIAPQAIINEVFAEEFNFDLEKFEELKKEKFFEVDFSEFANNIDIRQSPKFHRTAGKFVYSQLKNITSKKIKNFIAEPIVLGSSVSPSNYDENGEFYYISMANIKNWKFESEDSKLVSVEYAKTIKEKIVKKDDILIARSGEGTIGKIALIDDEDLNGIFADFTMRIRLKKYNPLFAYYYFRTSYFQYLVEINKKGLGNNTNIFPSQIQEFPLIDIDLERQELLSNKIATRLSAQTKINQKIEELRNKIDEIIENSIK